MSAFKSRQQSPRRLMGASRSRGRGFTLVEFSIVLGLLNVAAIIALRQEIADAQLFASHKVGLEILTIQDAATVFYSANNAWPDEAGNCDDAVSTLQSEDLLIGLDNSFWGSAYITECTGGPPRTLFTVRAAAPDANAAEVTASRVISAQLATAGGVTSVSSTVPIPGMLPGTLSDRFLHRVAVPGRPELNQMMTTLTMGDPAAPGAGEDINMNGNNIIGLNELRGDGSPLSFPDGFFTDGPATFNSDATFNNGLDWGDSELAILNGRGIVDLGSGGVGPGLIRFYVGGTQQSALEGTGGGLLATTNFNVGGDLSVNGDTELDGTLRVSGAGLFLSDVTMEDSLLVDGEILGGQNIVACSSGSGTAGPVCGVVVDSSSGTAVSLQYDSASDQVRLTSNRLLVTQSTNALFDINQSLFTGTVRSQGIMAGLDVRSLSGDSLVRAAQDVSIVANGTIISKPVCGPVAPRPEIYLALSQIAAGNPAPAMHQVAAFAVDNGTTWTARVRVLTPTGVVDPAPAFGQMLAIIKCEV